MDDVDDYIVRSDGEVEEVVRMNQVLILVIVYVFNDYSLGGIIGARRNSG